MSARGGGERQGHLDRVLQTHGLDVVTSEDYEAGTVDQPLVNFETLPVCCLPLPLPYPTLPYPTLPRPYPGRQ